jgi:hypothetical protein
VTSLIGGVTFGSNNQNIRRDDMAFNALWSLEALAKERNMMVGELLSRLLADLEALSEYALVFRLGLKDSGTHFTLSAADKTPIQRDEIPSESGFYCIFAPEYVIYLGEANNLRHRLLEDADGTADSTKLFSGQGRAILKYLMHFGCLKDVGIEDMLMQLYPGDYLLSDRPGNTFGSYYKLDIDKFRKSFEEVLALVSHRYHGMMVNRAIREGLLSP